MRIAILETENSKPINCNLAKALKRDIKERKDVIASIKQEKFDKRTTDRKFEKFSAQKLDEISFEIINLQDQIRKQCRKSKAICLRVKTQHERQQKHGGK